MLAGAPTLRTPDGERRLAPWDTAAFVPVEEGAHQLRNETDAVARVAFFATRSDPDVRVYPDDDTITVVANGRVL